MSGSVALWDPQQAEVQLGSSELYSLAASSFVTLGTIGDNTSGAGNLGLNTDFEIEIAVTTSASSGSPAYLALYAMPLNKGSGYGDGTASGTTAPGSAYFIGNVAITQNVTGVARGVAQIGALLPDQYQFGVVNTLANALAASGTFGVWIRPAAIKIG